MKRVLTIFTVFMFALISRAQEQEEENYSQEAGKVTQFEMIMTEYPKDTEAEAVTIYEKGDYRIVYSDAEGYQLYMTFHTKIKILSEAGVKYATFEIPLYSGDSRTTESLYDLGGVTYNYENESLVKTEFVTRGNVFDEKINEKWTDKKFTLPNVKVGSVIELKYTIISPYLFNMRRWEFQKRIPVVYSQLKYKAMPLFEYIYYINGVNKLDEFNSETLSIEYQHRNVKYREIEHTFGLNDIPAFRDEEFISSPKDYMISAIFQLARHYGLNGSKTDIILTWEALSKEVSKDDNFGKYINSARKEATKILPTLGLEGKSDLEKMKIITEYVKKNFNWNEFYGEYSGQKVSDFLKTKRGNIGDINLFLIGMLSEANIPVVPVILSTRGHGMINKSYPFMEYFNYVLAEVTIGDNKVHIDATESMLPYNSVPSRCLNVDGLVIDKEPKWTFVRGRATDYLQKQLDIEILAVNDIKVKASFGSSGQRAYTYRTKYMNRKDDLIKYIKDTESVDVDRDIEIANYEDMEKPFGFSFAFNTIAEGAGDKIFINPFCNLFPKDNLFKQTHRAHQVDINAVISRTFSSNIKIPKGYIVESIPQSMNLSNDVITVMYNTETTGDIIKIIASYTFKNYTYPAEQYDELKNSYAQMLSRFSEMIVFAKKE